KRLTGERRMFRSAHGPWIMRRGAAITAYTWGDAMTQSTQRGRQKAAAAPKRVAAAPRQKAAAAPKRAAAAPRQKAAAAPKKATAAPKRAAAVPKQKAPAAP